MRKSMILAMCMAAFLAACTNKAAESSAVPPIAVESETTYEAATEPESETARREEETTGQMETDVRLREYDALFPVYMDGHEDYIDRYGNLVTNYEFDRADYFYDGMAVVEKDGLMGAIDMTGTVVIPIKYSQIRHFSCGIAAVENEDGLVGYMNNSGEMITDFEYEAAGDFSENITVVREYLYYCFLDTKGNKVGEINIKGSYISDLHNGLVVMQNAYYNIHGECVIENNINASYAEGFFPSDFSEGLAVYPQLKDYYYQQYYGTPKAVDEFFNGRNWYYIYIDANGEDVFGKKYYMAGRFSEGLAVAGTGDVVGCIDRKGNYVFYNDNLDVNDHFSEGYLCYLEEFDGEYKYGFLDVNGNDMIPAMYYGCYSDGFHDGLALVVDNAEKTQLSYINKNNERVYTFSVPEEYRKWYIDYNVWYY